MQLLRSLARSIDYLAYMPFLRRFICRVYDTRDVYRIVYRFFEDGSAPFTVQKMNRKDVTLPVRMTASQRARLRWLAQRRATTSAAQVVREAADILYQIERDRQRKGEPPYPHTQQF